MKTTSLALVTVAALVLTGCGGEEQADERPPTSPLQPSDFADSDEPDVDQFAPNVGDRALSFGETRDGRGVDTTLEQVRYPYPPAEFRVPQAGNVFLGLRIEQCLGQETAGVFSTSTGEWAVVTPDGDEFAGSGSSWNDWPAPKFPESVTMTTDRCLKGWIAPEVPEGTEIASIVYRAGGETVAEWLPPERDGA